MYVPMTTSHDFQLSFEPRPYIIFYMLERRVDRYPTSYYQAMLTVLSGNY